MRLQTSFFYTAIVTLSQLAAVASPTDALDKEYDQVRKIAMRDPKVRESFEKANARLEAKIVEIDPSLKGYKPHDATLPPQAAAKPAAAPKHKQPSNTTPAPQAKPRSTHVIAAGDTFSSVAARYKITVAELKAVNPKVNERKLQVGNVLTLPSTSHGAPDPKPEKAGGWSWLKSKF